MPKPIRSIVSGEESPPLTARQCATLCRLGLIEFVEGGSYRIRSSFDWTHIEAALEALIRSAGPEPKWFPMYKAGL